MWLVLALVTMLFWSGSDIFSKIGSDNDDKQSHWKMVVAVGTVMGVYSLFQIFVMHVPITLDAFVAYLPASILYITSMILGYVALRYIELSLSSPICNSSGAVASLVMLIFFFSTLGAEGATLAGTVAGVCVCGIGVVLLGVTEMKEDDELRLLRQSESNRKYSKSWIALALPVLYCLLDAAGTVADSVILETLDENVANVAYGLTFFFMAIVGAIFVFAIKKEKFDFHREWAKGVGGVCETAGQIAYVFALSSNAVAAAPVISCYCVLSVLWGRLFLKEKLSKLHYLAVAITVVGIALLGVFGGE